MVKWIVYVVILLMTFHNIGVQVTPIFAASAALLVGVGLALANIFSGYYFWSIYFNGSICACWRYY